MLQIDGRTEFVKKTFYERFNPDEEYLGTDKPINKIEPLVSILVTTYQHEEFIEECLDGILQQKTNFTFEILVGEDESRDNTREICKKYAEEHPDKIRLFLRDRKTSQLYDEKGNFLCYFNVKWLRLSARGKYGAICEGDDYWTDENKLQKQIDFLISNSDYSMCFHNAKVIYTYKPEIHNFTNLREGEYTGDELYEKWAIPTASVVFPLGVIKNKDVFFNSNFIFSDFILFLTLAEAGRIWYFDEHMSVYRRHEGGQTHNILEKLENVKKSIFYHKEILQTFHEKYKKPAYKKISWFYFILFKATLKKNTFTSVTSLLQSFYYSPSNCLQQIRSSLRTR